MSSRTFNTQASVIQDRYKICFCGKYGVGKTTIFRCLRDHVRTVNRNNALEGGPPDSGGIGIDSITYVLPELNSEVILFDTGGLERHNSLSLGSYFKNAACIVAVYDVTDLDSLFYLDREFTNITQRAYCDSAKYIIFRNKSDMPPGRVRVEKERETDFLSSTVEFKEHIYDIVETSGLMDSGIKDFFLRGLIEVLKDAQPTRPTVQPFKRFYSENNGKKSFCC
ncbi:uncharacterized protein LOC130613873 [Hydractinia symbiolongicarpus]|uniref:uncharacterized protein LOC130613873 n=1 Tax=Hydractinia symbiolongicarpus TaxID=13093 RepID=UPI00254FDDD0|nr:uncharacterized protein LOC130613873 [Hydractinia symbiolongicarpus]